MLQTTMTNSFLLIFSVTASLLFGCSSKIEAEPKTEDNVAINLYSTTIEEQALHIDKSQLISTDSDDDGIPDNVSNWISELNEDKIVANALRRFAQSIQNAILLEADASTNISGPIMYNIVQSGYDIMLIKGMQSGKKLLDTVADQMCDTRAKSVKYMHFLKNFEPANNMRKI